MGSEPPSTRQTERRFSFLSWKFGKPNSRDLHPFVFALPKIKAKDLEKSFLSPLSYRTGASRGGERRDSK